MSPVDRTLFWDLQLASAAALVVASILEWPTKHADDAAVNTLRVFADYYRFKSGISPSRRLPCRWNC